MGIVLDETEAAGRLLESVKTHDETFYFATFGKEFVDLFFGGVEGEVADVESCCVGELVVDGGFLGTIFFAAVTGVAFSLTSLGAMSQYVTFERRELRVLKG
jgi:hypothetical protein